MSPDQITEGLAQTAWLTREGESAKAIAQTLGVTQRTVSRYRRALAAWGKIEKLSRNPKIPLRTKTCEGCGEEYGPKHRRDGGANWGAWRRSSYCSCACWLREARKRRWRAGVVA